jgi:hypothetical protein
MYSPKIKETLVPRIYRVAKSAGLPMTKWVNHVIEQALPETDAVHETNERNSRKEKRTYGRYGT